jgi:hypothetical protein
MLDREFREHKPAEVSTIRTIGQRSPLGAAVIFFLMIGIISMGFVAAYTTIQRRRSIAAAAAHARAETSDIVSNVANRIVNVKRPGSVSSTQNMAVSPPAPGGGEGTTKHLPVSPADQRRVVLDKLQASGTPGNALWAQEALQVFTKWQEEEGFAPLRKNVSLTPVQCFRDGCISTVTSSSEETAEQFNHDFPQSEAFNQWPGAKYHTALEVQPSGHALAAWVLFHPATE